MTSEAKSPTEDFAESTGMRYAYGFDTSKELMRALGVSGFPTAVLVDPGGIVVWKGHPSELSDELVEKSLAGAFTTPVWEWPKEGKKARKSLGKRAFGKALAELAGLEEPWAAEARGRVLGMATAWVASLEKALEEGNYRHVDDGLDEAKARIGGIEELETRVAALEEAYGADPEAKRGLKLQAKLEKILDRRLNTRRDVEKLIEELEAFRADAEGTWAAGEAARKAEELREMLR